MKPVRQRRRVAVAVILIGLLIAIGFIQEQRQGWPFSQRATGAAEAQHTTSHRPDEGMPASASARVPVDLAANQIEMLGVQFESVEVRTLDIPVHAVATIVVDESRILHVHTRVAGWLEELRVNTTGQHVEAGQVLGSVFSQELYSSQTEYLSAVRRAGSGPPSAVPEAARTRLTLLGMSDAEIEDIEQTGEARRLVTIRAPRSGIVLRRGVSQGTAVDPSTEILTIADLSEVWAIAEVAEGDAPQVQVGSAATLDFPLSGREPFPATVAFVYPTLTERTRTVRVRIAVPNPDGLLRPGMYGSARFAVQAREALAVSRDAVVDTGESQHVFVHTTQDTFEPRRVQVGSRFADRVEILEGLDAGEQVVTAGVFLIDSESRLRASGGAGHGGHGSSPGPASDEADRSREPPPHEH